MHNLRLICYNTVEISHMASILLHCCCGPCATYTIKSLREQNFEVTALWYNPNIHPFTEHEKRLESMNALAQAMDFRLILTDVYEMPRYLRSVVGTEDKRCTSCYDMRLSKTAQTAHENGFDAFSTTLLISPYQNQELLKEVGESAANENKTVFYFQDFRQGFRESQQLAKEFGLYKQKYCGCIYSEWERYAKIKVA